MGNAMDKEYCVAVIDHPFEGPAPDSRNDDPSGHEVD